MATFVVHGEGDFFPVYLFDSYPRFYAIDGTTGGAGFIDNGHVFARSSLIYGDPQLTFNLTGSFEQAFHGAPITGIVTGMTVTNSSNFDVFDITGINNVSLTD